MKKKMNKNLTVGLWLTGIMLTLILVGFFWTPYNPETMDNAAKLSGVSFSHLMGCDNFGRDIFSRVLKGGGTTFFVALGTVAIGTVFGVIIGAFTGYFGGILDEVLMRINDVLFAFPSILLALVFVTLLGGGTWNVIIALGIAFIPSFARIVRGEFIRCKNMDYVRSAKLAGAGLAQHPPHRVRQIGLARAVGADDAGDALVEAYPDLIGETLETLNFQFLEHHITFP